MSDHAQADTARPLAHASVTERDATVRESLLHALADYVEWSKAPISAANVVACLAVERLVGSEAEYVRFITGHAAIENE